MMIKGLEEVFEPTPKGEEFDILLRFTGDLHHIEIFLDDNVQTVIEGLLKEHGQLVVKVNWFSPGLTLIVPNSLHEKDLLNDSSRI